MKINLMFNIRAFVLIALLVCSRPVFGETNRYAGETWAFLDARQALAAASEITQAKYPDCDEATVEKKMVRVYRADGTGESQDETFVKVLTEKGKRNNRTISLDFMLPYSTVEVVKVEVIGPDGQATAVDVAANSKEQIDDSQMSENISDPNSRVLRLSIPKVEIGDVVHSITRETTERPIMPGEFADENVFEGEGYIRHLSYEVHVPKDRPLQRIQLRDEIPGTVRHSTQPGGDGSVIERWEVSNVPRMFPEPAMPPEEMVLQRLLVSTTPDWQAVSKWYWVLSKSHLDATTPDLTKTAQELPAGTTNEMEKIKAVFYYVSKNIRYMGLTPEKDRPGFEPHDVHLTFDKKYGVCRDKAALLVAMLRAAGLQAYPVLISVGVKRDPAVADPFFNHAIVSVELKKGGYVLMDPTDEHTRDLLPAEDCDQSYLVCRPEGEDLKISPVPPPEDHMMRIKTTGVLSAAGALEAKSELAFEGVNDDAYRNAFSNMKPDELRRFFESRLKAGMPGARLKSFKIIPEDMLDVSVPLRAELEFAVDSMTAADNGKSVVGLPWIGKNLGVINFILGGAGLDKRKYPMRTEVTCGLDENVSIKMAADYASAVSMPACPAVNDECVSYRESCGFATGALDCSREMKLKVVEFSPAQYLTLKQTLKSMQYDERKVPVLATSGTVTANVGESVDTAPDSPVESNAKILDVRKQLDVKDAHSAVYNVKYSKLILTYAGKIREAEVRVGFNPSCEEAKFIRGVVTSTNGQHQEISTNEINLMDAGWNASAKRYTGGKILVANLPGVDIGSTIEVQYEITTTNKPFLSGIEGFQLADEMVKKYFTVFVREDVNFQTMVSGGAGLIRGGKGGTNGMEGTGLVDWNWSAFDVKALPAEGQLPPAWIYTPCVLYYVGDLHSYLKDLNDAMLARSQKRARAAALAQLLSPESKSRLEAVQAIRDFVAKSIRLAGPFFTDLPLTELSDADTTLTEGYGHAADRAILLHAMLAAAGFQPEFVLASSYPPIAGITNVALSFPMPDSYAAPLVRINLDGQTYYLNDTDQYAKLGATSYDGSLGFVLSSQNCEVIKAARDCADKTETDYTLTLSDNGKTRIGVTRHYFGGNYGGKNRYFSELPPEERRRYFQEIVSGMAQGARPVGDLVTQFGAYPGLEQYTVEIDNYSVVDGPYLYFDLPFTPSLIAGGADRRALPMYISRHSENTVRTEIDLPAGFRRVVIAPRSEYLNEPDGGGSARITSAASADKIVLTDDFAISPAIISPRDYSALLQVESTLGRKSSTVFLLEKTTGQ
jgi:transglutaminase-like putative cysteine protease